MDLGKGLLEKSKRILDTNFVLRYLLKDVPDMFEIACNNIMHGDCSVYPEIIAEAVYVLKSVYKVDRIEILNAIISFLDEVICEKKEVVVKGLLLFAETTFDKKIIKKLT